MSEPILSIKDLRVRFGDIEAVRGISFDLRPGQRLGIVGESGSGKSVTALSIMQLVRGATTSGSIMVGDKNVLKLGRRELERMRGGRVGMIYQDPMSSLNPVHRIGRQLTEALMLHTELRGRAAKDRAAELLAEVGVKRPTERLEAYPHQFSGGMRQRVMIAMALCGNPEILIADEPTTALDVTTQARIIDLLHGIVDTRGAGVILITHDMGVAAGFCDDIHVMRHGTILESASAEDLYGKPQNPYTAGLLGAVVDLQTDVTRPIPTIDEAAGAADSGSPVASVEVSTPTAAVSSPRTGPDPAEAGPAGAPPIIDVSGLRKTFALGRDRITAVDDVSFSIRRGETFGLVGESGSGKSTVARCVLNLTKPDDGDVTFRGQSITQASRREMLQLRRQLQIVFQDPFSALNRRQSVQQIVMAPLTAHHIGTKAERAERATAMLELVGLDSRYVDRLPRELSGGQCQRVAIARSLVLEPDFLILDESVSALDVSIQAQVLNLLRDLQSRLGLSYLFVSHDLAVIRYMCTEIAVMQAGRVVEQASREELFNDPQSDYTRALLEAVPVADPRTERARRGLKGQPA